MFPSNTSLTKVEAVAVFNSVHVVANIVRDLCLQLADESLEDPHFGNGQESGLLQSPAVARDGREAVVKVVQTLVGLQLSSKMMSSQITPPCVSWLGVHLRHERECIPLRLYTEKSDALPVIGGATRNSPVPAIQRCRQIRVGYVSIDAILL